MLLPIWFFLLPQPSAGGREAPSSHGCALPRQLKSLPVPGALPGTATATELPLAISSTLGVLSARKQGTWSLSVCSIMIITEDINQMSLI